MQHFSMLPSVSFANRPKISYELSWPGGINHTQFYIHSILYTGIVQHYLLPTNDQGTEETSTCQKPEAEGKRRTAPNRPRLQPLPPPLKKETTYHPQATPTERALCLNCARYDWRYHLTCWENPALSGAEKNHWEDTRKQRKKHFDDDYVRNPEEWDDHLELLPLFSILANQGTCTLCSLIVSHLRAYATQAEIDRIESDRVPVSCYFWNPFDKHDGDRLLFMITLCTNQEEALEEQISVHLKFTFHDTTSMEGLDPLTESALGACGRPMIKEDQIDWLNVRQWLMECDSSHKSCRVSSASQPKFGKSIRFRVIDTYKNRLVWIDRVPRFVALSYVWGNVEPYKSAKRDLVAPNAMNNPGEYISLNLESLPQTVRDAMRVVRLIGEQYLWVDAVCIAQDDEAEKTATIGVMDRIYASAILTIVAASGVDANAGLIGVNPDSRSIHSLPGTVDGIGLIRWEPPHDLEYHPWTQRGWTYQRSYFSSRMLIFANDRVFYTCEYSSYGEARPLEALKTCLMHHIDDTWYGDMHHDRDEQVFFEIADHITEYTFRQLKFSGDILQAFAGITNHYMKQHKIILLWGIPHHYLGPALAWRSGGKRSIGREPLSRRCDKIRPFIKWRDVKKKKKRLLQIPSWSWAGWIGQVHYTEYAPVDYDESSSRIIDLQRREWEAANPVIENIRIG